MQTRWLRPFRARLPMNPNVICQQPPRAWLRQRGMSLVELMVGITIGLFIVAAATMLVGNQLADNRRLVLETQLQQDMRATMDIITRQLRRAGAVGDGDSKIGVATDSGVSGYPDATFTPISQPGSSEITFRYYQTNANLGPFGFRLDKGVIEMRLDANTPFQALTDANVVNVTKLEFVPLSVTSAVIPCPNFCPAGGTACWPTVKVRSYRVVLEATPVGANNADVRRSIQSEVRLRNDLLDNSLSGNPTQACPA
jgi:prepilin-type N-terminal cleavage/methylation domain-containing protein